MKTLNIAIAGSSGRMGRTLLKEILKAPSLRLYAALEQTGNSFLGKDAGELIAAHLDIAITDNFSTALPGSDVLIDFTRPDGTLKHLLTCRTNGVKMVIGTTGFSSEQKKMLETASRDIAIVFAPNMSVGMNVTFKLLEIAARTLNDGYDIEIIEAHHRHKEDAPSGTALQMGEVMAQALNRNLSDVAVYARKGFTGERKSSAIGFSSVRGGDIVGDHTVMFAGTGERIDISHKANNRETFAAGALRAAHFLMNKKNGLFDMQDVLGLR
ncbi:4-hydroxy-tetrahydrodipicolinate reductase [Nitrosomonadaceae bacterium]|nr:4-hydroxy-tetrahydrodipicolinate reductase [Nitrosospira sp.]MDW7652897.1 4-hydroxy-tetrahydrodipicolinate reductase [Nitrosomonadaceae bacterium]MBI0417416.1 4-hydroxy-tetrahydrodipicolinate reductase [Nitrosospira sp.]MBI0419121.1 4-hydroxy-tetrahydrodipicolinate reductase [Nitrosospira sp.]MCX7182372.1 4-hydroxy-tetrahydrodipicolinate reductase [Nitrosospira sp.]